MAEVKHLPEEHRFVIDCEDEEAVLLYRVFMNNDTTAIDFSSTYVPTQHRGKGLAEKLVRVGLEWAKAQHYELHASCWYVAKFIR